MIFDKKFGKILGNKLKISLYEFFNFNKNFNKKKTSKMKLFVTDSILHKKIERKKKKEREKIPRVSKDSSTFTNRFLFVSEQVTSDFTAGRETTEH